MPREGRTAVREHLVWDGRADFEAFRNRRPITVQDAHRFHAERWSVAAEGVVVTECTLPLLAGVTDAGDRRTVVVHRVRAGSVRYWLRGRLQTGRPGSTHLLPGRTPVRFAVVEPLRVLRVLLDVERISPVQEMRHREDLFGPVGPSPVLDLLAVAAERVLGADTRDAATAIAAEVGDLAAVALRQALADETAELRSRILRHVDEHLSDPDLRPRTIADAFGISLRWLYEVFDGADGALPIASHIRARRCDAVAERLRRGAGPRSVAALAQEHGFAGRDQLTRAFRARYGCSVTEYAAGLTA